MSVIQVVQHKLEIDHIGVATPDILQVIVMSLSILVATAICGDDRSKSGTFYFLRDATQAVAGEALY